MKFILICLAVTTASFNAFAYRGGISDGGGKGVVCRDSNHKILSAKTLDIYEGRAFWGLNIPESTAPYQEQVKTAVRRMETTGIEPQLRTATEMIQKALKILPPGDALVEINDSLQSIIPKCPIEQLANFFNPSHVVVSGDIWAHLGETDKAALILHEALYYLDRDTGVKDSRRARRITAELLRDQNIFTENPMEGVVRDYTCYTVSNGVRDARNIFYVYKEGDHFKMQFAILEGEHKLFKTTATLRAVKGEPDFWNSLTKTEAAFEGGDTIRIWTESKVTNKQVEIRTYMDGLSGWLPGKQFPKRDVHCLTLRNGDHENAK